MTTTMREKGVRALLAALNEQGVRLTADGMWVVECAPDGVSMASGDPAEVLDAILDTLREPDLPMREAGLRAIPDCDVASPIHHKEHAAFVSMIDHVRKG